MFELNFNDERYLPFEGAGVISDWQINMPIENNQFDFASLSDAVLHISYTSRSGGGELMSAANNAVQAKLPTETARLFSLKHEFTSEWHKFLNPVNDEDQEMIFDLVQEHLPFFIRSKHDSLKIKQLDIFIESDIEDNFISNVKITDQGPINGLEFQKDEGINSFHHCSIKFEDDPLPSVLGEISMKIKTNVTPDDDFSSLKSDQIGNIFILLQLGS
jgi:hypothetical protein